MAVTASRLQNADAGSVPFGKVFTPKQLSELWQLSGNTIWRLFQNEPGMFTLGESNPRGRRPYCTLRITEQIALKVWREHRK